ncbi:MAG TPA: aconitate hydratase, partial [Plasticicumulans sp.]|nr:aconitate hydratase [Plasticicumulans sp.]
MTHDPFDVLRVFTTASGQHGRYCSLAALESAGLGAVSRLPVSLRLVLESVLRHCDGENITEAHVRALAGWQPQAPRSEEIPFVVARVVLQDFTGVPLLCDLAAMR